MELEPLIPNSVIFDRAPILKRSIRGLPDEMLRAMIEGIESDPDGLVAGRLFKERERGGCPVGMMLRVLYPSRYSRRWFRRSRSDPHVTGIACEQPRLAKQMPRLRHLEHVFDTTVRSTLRRRPQLSHQDAARAAGLWFSAEAQAELENRRGNQLPWPADGDGEGAVVLAGMVGASACGGDLVVRGGLPGRDAGSG